jgi:DnaJ-class molecular chaperone
MKPNKTPASLDADRTAKPRTRLVCRLCRSCRGYGHMNDMTGPSVDKRDRKCLDCGGSGRVPFTQEP